MADHLARLCLLGEGSTGSYTPHAYRLRLAGVTQSTDHVVHLHEVHHAALNDVTAWGSALHVFARLPGEPDPRFEHLLDACRTTHESLATFAAVQIASARHGELGDVLAAYPEYVPLYETTRRLVAGVPGANRRQQITTALARLCMQTPILDEIVAAGLDGFQLTMLREIDRPDARWHWFVRRGPELLATAAEAADREVVAAFGRGALEADGPGGDLYTSTDRSHDEAWDLWEAAAYGSLRGALRTLSAARTMDITDHQAGTAALLALTEASHGDLGLRAAMTDDQRRDDAAIASALLQQVRHELTDGDPHRAALLSADPTRTASLVAEHSPPEHGPALVVHARPPGRLAELYRWQGSALPEPLRATGEPVVAVRLIGDDGAPGDVVAHAVLAQPPDLAELRGRWAGQGPQAACVSASCVADPDWARRWWPEFRALGPVFVLVDVELERFVPRWARDQRDVAVIGIDLQDTGGRRTALLFTAGDDAWWLVLADDVTIRLVHEYLAAQLGPRVYREPGRFDAIRDAATAVLVSLLATESFTSFDAIGAAGADKRSS